MRVGGGGGAYVCTQVDNLSSYSCRHILQCPALARLKYVIVQGCYVNFVKIQKSFYCNNSNQHCGPHVQCRLWCALISRFRSEVHHPRVEVFCMADVSAVRSTNLIA